MGTKPGSDLSRNLLPIPRKISDSRREEFYAEEDYRHVSEMFE